MFRLCIFILVLQFGVSALGAKNKDHWYKVESKEPEKKQKKQSYYPYDSVEKGTRERTFRKINIWSLRPKLSLGGGYQLDKAFFNDKKTNRFFVNAALRFRARPWHRLTANVQLMQYNSLFIGGSWEFTPSRERVRNYYGLGVAHLLVSDKKFSNLVEFDAYYATIHYGWEMLNDDNTAWNLEAKGFYSGANYAIQVLAGYVIPF